MLGAKFPHVEHARAIKLSSITLTTGMITSKETLTQDGNVERGKSTK